MAKTRPIFRRGVTLAPSLPRLACAGLLTAGVGIGNADTIQTEGNYPTREACRDAGPGVKASTPGNWNNFWCVPDRDVAGNWKLVLSN